MEGSCCSEAEITKLYDNFYTGEKKKLLATTEEMIEPYYTRHNKLIKMADYLDDLSAALFPDLLSAVSAVTIKFDYLN